ncbi:MAG: thiolase domain-containing protein [Thermoanaerobaculia bacterium]
MREIAVLGYGLTKFGELWDKSLRDLFVEASLKAIEKAGIEEIDALYVGCMSSGLFNEQEHLGALMADYLGKNPIPATRIESACASGGAAVLQGVYAIASGFYETVLVGGVEKMTDISGGNATIALGTAADSSYELFFGATFPGLYALMATAHMEKYGTTRDALSMVAVKNHFHGKFNPYAQFPFEITKEQVLQSPMVAEPLHLLDCSPITDGAAAIVLTTKEKAEKIGKPYILLKGFGQASDTIALYQREDITFLGAVSKAAERAYKMANIAPKDICVAEVHDCFTIAEIMVYEALGFAEKGKGQELILKGETKLGGKIPVNTSGGLKAKGHPVGATGVAQVCEIFQQLTGEAGERQVEGAKIGLCQNMGGTGASSVVTIWEVKK